MLILAAGICRADFVGESTVRDIAGRWFGSAKISIELDSSRTLYYVNAADGGWLIISAEDSATPIIGYNDSGSISPERMPSNMSAWMDNTYIKGIKLAREARLEASEPVKKLWKTAGVRTKAASRNVLETARWDQDTPYNLYCPKVTEYGRQVTALTGCVATAAAIICRYHEWPQTGRGSTEAYTFRDISNKTVSVSAIDLSSRTYDYSLMPLDYTGSESTAQKQAVARLMADLGAGARLGYGYAEGTGGYAEDMLHTFVYNMSYNPEACTAYKGSYTDAEWISIIKREIDADRPVFYGGYGDASGGHQYVCDGYDEKDYLHINWGWSGDYNGFFTFKMQTADYYFDKGHSIIVNLEPDRSGDAYTAPNGGPLIFIDYDTSKGGLAITSGSILSKTFTVKITYIYNADWHNSYDGSIRMALTDHKGGVKEVISSTDSMIIPEEQVYVNKSIKCTVKGDYAIGDRVVCQFLNKEGNWEDITVDPEYCTGVNGIPVFDTPFLAERSSYAAGDNFVIDLIPGSSQISSYTWTFDGKKQSHVSAALTPGEHTVVVTVKCADNTTYVITKKIFAD